MPNVVGLEVPIFVLVAALRPYARYPEVSAEIRGMKSAITIEGELYGVN